MEMSAAARTAKTPRTATMRRMRAPAARSVRAMGFGSALNGMSGAEEFHGGGAAARADEGKA